MTPDYRLARIAYFFACFSSLCSTTLWAQPVETIDRLRNKAETYYAQGDYRQALTCYLDGYRLARRLDHVRAANLAVDISSIYHMQGDYSRGAVICHEGAALLTRAATQPDSVWFKLNSSLGEMYKKMDRQDSCYLYFSRANTILRQHPDLEGRIAEYVIFHYNNQGMMYVRAGGYTEGLGYLTKALSVAERYTTSKADIAILQNNLGRTYEDLGQFEKALSLRKTAIEKYPKNDYYKYQIYNGASWDALQSAGYYEGIYYATKALLLSKSFGKSPSDYANVSASPLSLNRLGQAYYLLNNYERAIHYYFKAIDECVSSFGTKGIILANSYLGLAYVHKSQKRISQSLSYCQQAIITAHSSFSSTSLALNPTPEQALSEQALLEALILKADLLAQRFAATRNRNDLRLSCSTYVCALSVADAMRKSYNALETKWFFATQVRPAYLRAFDAAETLYEQTRKIADQEQAFSLLERSKAAALADITREALLKPANVPTDLLNQERNLQRTITNQKLTSTASPSLNDAQIQLAQLQQRFEREFPAYYRAKYQPQTVSSAAVRASLDSRTAYLSYLLTSSALYIAVMTPDGLAIVRRQGNLSVLTSALKTLDTTLYTNPGLGNYTGSPAAIMAYRWLIEPVAQRLKNTERLVISRDGPLHRLPFEVLETGRVIDDFLGKHYAISYTPSAAALLHSADSAVVNPKNTLLSLAPFAEPVGGPTAPLPYLPASQGEVEPLPGDVWLGKTATKSRFMHSYAGYNLLHLATHAVADNAEPARSYIAFYPDGNPDRLYAGEVYNLSLPHTRLVVLSACETGNGRLQAGEGVMSLAQAFGYAGCPAVVSTLWGANDESTAYLSRQLYEHLQAGLPVDVALQRTRLDYFRSSLYPKLNHPHYWANLILIGANRPVYAVPWPTTRLLSALGVLLLCGAGVLMRWQRRRISLPRSGSRDISTQAAPIPPATAERL